MSGIPCPACEAETVDGLLCGRCASRFRRDLETIASLWPALEDALTRQTRRVNHGGHSNDRTPLPLDARASRVRGYVAVNLETWTEILDMGDAPERAEPAALARWLAKRSERIRTHEAGDEAVAEFAYCRSLVWSVVDLPADRIYCGSCDLCGGDLYARPGAVSVVCQRCERAGVIVLPVDVAQRREAMKAKLEDVRATRDEVLTAVPMVYGMEINRGTLDSWISRGRLSVSGGRIRIGDVLDLAAGMSARRGA